MARLQAGELFGESGVLEGRCRVASATAVAVTTVLVTEAEVFHRAFGLENDAALMLLKLLCRRLRSTTLLAARPERVAREVVAGGSRAAAVAGRCAVCCDYQMQPVDIRHLPFQVGNRFGGEVTPIASNAHCCIAAHGEPGLAAPHFEILRRDGRLGVRDLGSRDGTIVNGVAITRASRDPLVVVHAGENEIIAGRAQSRFRFRLLVPGQAKGI